MADDHPDIFIALVSSFGWVRRPDLDTASEDVWELPDGTLKAEPKGAKPELARLSRPVMLQERPPMPGWAPDFLAATDASAYVELLAGEGLYAADWRASGWARGLQWDGNARRWIAMLSSTEPKGYVPGSSLRGVDASSITICRRVRRSE